LTLLASSSRISTCPSAGICARLCYARSGTYLFSNVLAAHTRNLQLVIDDRDEWRTQMICELNESRFTRRRPARVLPIERHDIADDWLRAWSDSGAPAIRIHDSGDFFADWYLDDWLTIASAHQHLLFYAYTKEITMLSQATLPHNFRWLASTGGTQDHLITDDMRHADVFPDEQTLTAAGYESQAANDLLCVLLPSKRIGIAANNIPHYKKRMAGRTLSAWVLHSEHVRNIGIC